MTVWMLGFEIVMLVIMEDSTFGCHGYLVRLLRDTGHSLPALASKKRTIAATDGLSSTQP